MKTFKKIFNIFIHSLAITVVTAVVQVSPEGGTVWKVFSTVDIALAISTVLSIWFIVAEVRREYKQNKILSREEFENARERERIKHSNAKELEELKHARELKKYTDDNIENV